MYRTIGKILAIIMVLSFTFFIIFLIASGKKGDDGMDTVTPTPTVVR